MPGRKIKVIISVVIFLLLVIEKSKLLSVFKSCRERKKRRAVSRKTIKRASIHQVYNLELGFWCNFSLLRLALPLGLSSGPKARSEQAKQTKTLSSSSPSLRVEDLPIFEGNFDGPTSQLKFVGRVPKI